MIEVNEQLAEVISNSRVAFINGQMCKSIKSAIPDTEGVDEQLGTENDK